MKENALLLAGSSESSVASRLEKILAVFGVACAHLTVMEFLSSSNDGKVRIFATAGTFLELAGALGKNPEAANKIHSAFVFAGDDAAAFIALAKIITSDARASLVQINSGTEWNVTDKLPEFCKSMSGLRAVAGKNGAETTMIFDAAKSGAEKIIGSGDGAAFAKFEFQNVPVFLSTADVIDVGAPLSARVFDVRPHFLTAVPVVLYVKWAFAETCWQSPETPACLVIDDPLLQPRYGFLNFQRLLDLMERVNFSTSIAFIPWNCNRSGRKTIRLFQENPTRLSLSVHGCDHTGGEFGSRNRGRLAWKSKQAMQRMARHQSRTGLSHDPVMVFPQGVFSETAMSMLKRGDFIGTVNSEVISTDPQPRTISIADYWNVAVMNYSDFPIFTRRYPWAGVENFAFDILLGKPCIVVVHHNDCHDDCRHVAEFMERLNRLNARLHWTNLAEVVRRSFLQREILPGIVEVEMYGREVRIENPSSVKKVFRLRKREAEPTTIKEIRAAAQPVKWTAAENHIAFEFELNPGESKTVTITFNEPADEGFAGENLRYKLKAMVRRYLCEIRDNYVMRKSFSQ